MFSKSLKKKVAVLLTGIMVLGMTVSASAATGTLTGSNDSNGTGSFEGTVDRAVVNVTLPTVAAGTSPFSFIYDPEGLIEETHGKAYGEDYNTAFPAGKYVFFKTGDKQFGEESTEYTVSNNSSVSVNVTLKIDVTPGAKDAALVSESKVPDDYDPQNPTTKPSMAPSIFLGLVVDGDADATAGDKNGTYALTENTVTKTFNLAGVPGNFHVSANEVYGEDVTKYPHGYSFLENDDASGWKELQFKLKGKANKVANAAGMTAPDLKVTWSFAMAGEAEAEEEEETVTPVDAYSAVQNFDGTYVLLTKPSESTTFEGLTAVSGITSYELKLNDGAYVDAIDKAMVYQGMVGVTYQDAQAKLGFEGLESGDKITTKVVIGETTYVAVFTNP